MKLVLVRPWWHTPGYYGFEERASLPLGLASIAAVLERKGYDVAVLDCLAEGVWKEEEIRNRLQKEAPDIIGISLSTFNRFQGLKVAKIAKRLGSIVIAGGVHVTFDFRNILERIRELDYLVVGEGEETMPELVKAVEKSKPLNQIKGIAYRKEDKIKVNQPRPLVKDLALLPLPAYHLFPMDKYSYHLIMASRGCPYRCIFCASPQFWKGVVRFRPYQSVVDEIEYLVGSYGRKYFTLRDDMIFTDKSWCLGFLSELIKRNLAIKWSVMARADAYDLEVFSLMKEAGCTTVRFGVESGSQKIMHTIRKNISKDDVRRAVGAANKCGFKVGVYFMLGHPNETIQDLEESYEFCRELNTSNYVFEPTSIYPGTSLFQLAKKEGVLSPDFNWLDEESLRPFEKGFGTSEGTPVYCQKGFSRRFLENTARRFYIRRFLDRLSCLTSYQEIHQLVLSRQEKQKGSLKPADLTAIFKELVRAIRIKKISLKALFCLFSIHIVRKFKLC